MAGDGMNTYQWDARNRLVSISRGGTAIAAFAYDAFGRRTSKTINGVTTQFVYDGANPVQEVALPVLGGMPVPTVADDLLTGLHADEFFTRTDTNNNASTFLADALGTTMGLVTAPNGSMITTSYTYEPFVNTAFDPNNPYQFTGRENDGTGLYYYRARYYSPALQRFISQDPSDWLGGDPNLYGYVLNSPPNLRDPSGRQLALLIVGGALGAGEQAYAEYGAYNSGAITGTQYAESIAFGAATGILAAIPGGGLVGAAFQGGFADAANNLFDQRLNHPCSPPNFRSAAAGFAFGALAGAGTAEAGILGDNFLWGNGPDVIGQPPGAISPPPSLAIPAGAVGSTIGGALGSYYGL
ncbi:MAG: RHS repeat-associated core domain-containing protein [Candidatus Binataceae bacterium]